MEASRPLVEMTGISVAFGPVQTGSYGQSQIHALEFRVRRG